MDPQDETIALVKQIIETQNPETAIDLCRQLLSQTNIKDLLQSKNRVETIHGDGNQVGDREIQTRGGNYYENKNDTIHNHNNIILGLDSLVDRSSYLTSELKKVFLKIPDPLFQEAYQKFIYSDRTGDRSLWETSDDVDGIVESIINHRKVNQFFACLFDPLLSATESNQSSESYILATLKPCAERKNFFHLKAWLIEYDIQQNLVISDIPLIDRAETQPEILCTVDRIEKHFNDCLHKALKHPGGQQNLTIEVFLPKELMCTEVAEVDRWKIYDSSIDEKIPLGSLYRVRLRSLERLESQYLYKYKWHQSWKRVQKNLQNQNSQALFKNIESMQDVHFKDLDFQLTDNQTIGLRLNCVPSKPEILTLVKAILRATTPIAIWPRRHIPNCDRTAAIDEILTIPLCNFCETVKKMRHKADVEWTVRNTQHLGLHLAVLWENPHRLTPDVDAQLRSPGE